eukprot:4113495-Karenia_brevis.AAC.1
MQKIHGVKGKTWPIRGYLPKLKRDDGSLVVSEAEAAEVRQKHFASMEAATTVDFNTLMDSHQVTRTSHDFVPVVHNIPTLQYMTQEVLHSKLHKATGPDP